MDSVLFCVATEKGYEAILAASQCSNAPRICVCTFDEQGVTTCYANRIRRLANDLGMPIIDWRELRASTVAILKRERISGILCIGWRYLISDAAVEYLSGNVVVAHDSLLPKLRGFAPLATALIIGEARTGVTFIRAGDKVDNGQILWQESFEIGPTDSIADLIQRVIPLYREGAIRFLNGRLVRGTSQDERFATYSIWRDDLDYEINWSLDSVTIERTVRALGHPYLGARCRLNGKTVIVHHVNHEPDIQFAIRQPGKVWSVDSDGNPAVICGSGLLRIMSAETEGKSILPLDSLRSRFE